MTRPSKFEAVKALDVVGGCAVATAVVLAMSATAGAATPAARNGLIVFASNRGPDRLGEIYVVGPTGGKPRNLSESPSFDSGPVVSPRGSRIAFFSRRSGYEALYVERIDGSRRRRLTGKLGLPPWASLEDIAWAPRGDAIAFASRDQRVFVASTAARSVRLLAKSASRPSWSADGKRIAYMDVTALGSPSVVVVRRDGHRLWARPGGWPHWAPRGSRLAYESAKDGVVVADAGGRKLAAYPGFGFRAWSPDGRWLAASLPSGVFALRVEGKLVRRLGDPAFEPVWSPDSKKIALSRFERSSVAVSVVRVGDGRTSHIADTGPAIAWSPDGRRILLGDSSFQRFGSVSSVRPNGRGLRRLVRAGPGSVLSSVGWAQGGRRVVYRSEFQGALFTVRPDGRHLRRLTRDGGYGDSTPAWSPDGRKVALARSRRPDAPSSLFVLSLGDRRAKLAADDDFARDPAWSPDGSRIAYSYSFYAVHLVRLGDQQPIEVIGAGGTDPSWSPQGDRIAYTGRYGGVFVTDSGRVVADGASPSWSPDGRWLAYSGPGGIRRVHPDGSGDGLIAAGASGSPAWSPDGEWLVFSDGNLWVIRKNGTDLHQLTSGAANDSSPSWQPLPG